MSVATKVADEGRRKAGLEGGQVKVRGERKEKRERKERGREEWEKIKYKLFLTLI